MTDVTVQTCIDVIEVGVQVSPIDILEASLPGSFYQLTTRRFFGKLLTEYYDFNMKPFLKRDASVQTEYFTEINSYPIRKRQLIPDIHVLKRIDERVRNVNRSEFQDTKELAETLMSCCIEEIDHNGTYFSEIFKVRAFFRWITENIRYDSDDKTDEISKLKTPISIKKTGSSIYFSELFEELCYYAGIIVKTIKGFAKGKDFLPGKTQFTDRSIFHFWNSVFVMGHWRLIDCSRGGAQYEDFASDEHYFLGDPDKFIFTHFPYQKEENNYSQWQLLTRSLTIQDFNALPTLTASFFEYKMKILDVSTDIINENRIKFLSNQVMRYKWRFFPAMNSEEDHTFYNDVFCYLNGRKRRLGYFWIRPRSVGVYYLKIYAKPESLISKEYDNNKLYNNDFLDHVATIRIRVLQVLPGIQYWPRTDVPWGLTHAFFDTGAILVNYIDGPPILPLTLGHSTSLIFLTPNVSIVTAVHFFDFHGNKLILDESRNFIYSALLNKLKPIPHSLWKEDECSLQPYIHTSETKSKITLTIHSPPRVGCYKMQIYGCKKPHKRGKYQIPLIANFLIDVTDVSLRKYC